MKILITGANGYLGKGVVKQLLDDGVEVFARQRNSLVFALDKYFIGALVVTDADWAYDSLDAVVLQANHCRAI